MRHGRWSIEVLVLVASAVVAPRVTRRLLDAMAEHLPDPGGRAQPAHDVVFADGTGLVRPR